jgi:uncharacterized protein
MVTDSLISVTLSLFLAGLLGGLHCVGMCGGLFGALSASGDQSVKQLRTALHVGRVLSYGVLGVVVGSLGGMTAMFEKFMPIQIGFYVFANMFLLLVSCYLLGWSKPMARVEAWGGKLWRFISPLTRALIPLRTRERALLIGLLWGFMPCGLVYGALAMALLSRSAIEGGAMMVMFGLGTLPNLLAAGALARRIHGRGLNAAWRIASGALVGGFGVYGLAHATQLDRHIRAGLLCLGNL